MQEKSRLDALLAARGVYDSRSRAAAAVRAGEVRVGPQRAVASKAGMLVAPDVEVARSDASPGLLAPRCRRSLAEVSRRESSGGGMGGEVTRDFAQGGDKQGLTGLLFSTHAG